jgi:hypothetical protein
MQDGNCAPSILSASGGSPSHFAPQGTQGQRSPSDFPTFIGKQLSQCEPPFSVVWFYLDL